MNASLTSVPPVGQGKETEELEEEEGEKWKERGTTECLRRMFMGRGKRAPELAWFCASPGQTEIHIQTVRVSLQPTASWGLSGEIP